MLERAVRKPVQRKVIYGILFAIRSEAIASRLEAIAVRLEAIASRLEAIAVRLEAIASRLEAIAIRLEAIASRLEAVALRFRFALSFAACLVVLQQAFVLRV